MKGLGQVSHSMATLLSSPRTECHKGNRVRELVVPRGRVALKEVGR